LDMATRSATMLASTEPPECCLQLLVGLLPVLLQLLLPLFPALRATELLNCLHVIVWQTPKPAENQLFVWQFAVRLVSYAWPGIDMTHLPSDTTVASGLLLQPRAVPN